MLAFFRHPNYYKKFCIFFSSSLTMSGKNIILMIKRSARVIFIKTKNYLIYMTSMLVKYWFIKKNLMAKKAPSNTLLDIIMMMMPLDHNI